MNHFIQDRENLLKKESGTFSWQSGFLALFPSLVLEFIYFFSS